MSMQELENILLGLIFNIVKCASLVTIPVVLAFTIRIVQVCAKNMKNKQNLSDFFKLIFSNFIQTISFFTVSAIFMFILYLISRLIITQ